TVLFSRNDVLAYLTDMGGTTSHSALLARSLKIPSVVGLKTFSKNVQTGDYVIVDGYNGSVIQHPTRATIRKYKEMKEEHRIFDLALKQIRTMEAETLDGKKVDLSGNIEFSEEGDFIKEQGAHGIGLYRTEGLFIREDDDPSEEVQRQEYAEILKGALPYKVVMRTLDVGGDKVVTSAIEEENPFLGWRGIRISLDRPEIFLRQVRAMLRASVHGKAWIMLPMISGVKEVRRAKELIEQAKKELRNARVPFDEEIKIGAMIEVPSAAVTAGDIAAEVDFLSIGTNDLIQYLIAVDRGNEVVSHLYQEFHPAVVQTIAHIINEGHRVGKHVAMCGEMAGDPIATLLLLGLGLDEFSVTPIVLPEIKKIIRSIRFSEAKEVAEHCLTMKTEEEIREFLRINVHQMVPDLLLPE
ncbi:MAG: phosphoenolpyruvate--protein phosphotransferase, partial [Bacteroidetes bacterium]|nr:phosphoenolpyruvate--protein phosphotransferase [Bacteroidota bacterium]